MGRINVEVHHSVGAIFLVQNRVNHDRTVQEHKFYHHLQNITIVRNIMQKIQVVPQEKISNIVSHNA